MYVRANKRTHRSAPHVAVLALTLTAVHLHVQCPPLPQSLDCDAARCMLMDWSRVMHVQGRSCAGHGLAPSTWTCGPCRAIGPKASRSRKASRCHCYGKPATRCRLHARSQLREPHKCSKSSGTTSTTCNHEKAERAVHSPCSSISVLTIGRPSPLPPPSCSHPISAIPVVVVILPAVECCAGPRGGACGARTVSPPTSTLYVTR